MIVLGTRKTLNNNKVKVEILPMWLTSKPELSTVRITREYKIVFLNLKRQKLVVIRLQHTKSIY